MVTRILVVLRKLNCTKQSRDDEANVKFVQEIMSITSETSGTSSISAPDKMVQSVSQSMTSFMDQADRAFDRLHGKEQRDHRIVDRVEMVNEGDYGDPISFISMEDTKRPVKTILTESQENPSMISTVTLDPALQWPDEQLQQQHHKHRGEPESTVKDPPGFRRMRNTTDKKYPIAQHHRESLQTLSPDDVNLEDSEMSEFNDEESVLYVRFSNSIIMPIPEETALTKFVLQDPSESTLSEVAGYQLVEV